MAGQQQTPASRRRWRRIGVLLVAGVALAGVIALYATMPPLTILSVHVVDAGTGAPLAGARVLARLPGQDPLPAVTAGDDGIARFEFFEGQAGYQIQVQLVNYDRWIVNGVTVADRQETVLPAPLVHNPRERLFVGLEGSRLVQVDVASLTHIQTIILPVPAQSPVRYLRLHPSLDLLYATAGAQGQVLSSLTGATLATFDVQASAIDSLEVSADGRYVLATGLAEFDPAGIAEQRHLWVLNAESGTLISDTILSRADSHIEVEWQPDGVDTYVLLATSSVVDRVTASNATWGQLSNVAFRARGYPNRVNLSPSGEWLYTWVSRLFVEESGAYRDLLVMVSTEDGEAVYQETTPGIVAIGVSPTDEFLFVLNQDLGTLTAIDLATDGSQAFVPVGKQPVALTVSGDGTRVYIADRGGPAVVVVDVASMRVIESIPMPAAPLSVAVR